MAKRDRNFHDYVLYDLLGGLDGIASKPMFSGWGIFKNGKIFALINESELFLKGNEKTRKLFESGGGAQFEYEKKSYPKPVKLPYWSVPEEILENRELLSEWVRVAIEN